MAGIGSPEEPDELDLSKEEPSPDRAYEPPAQLEELRLETSTQQGLSAKLVARMTGLLPVTELVVIWASTVLAAGGAAALCRAAHMPGWVLLLVSLAAGGTAFELSRRYLSSRR